MDFLFKEKEFLKCKKLAEDAYNMSVVVDYFCKLQPQEELLANISPIIREIRSCTDKLLADFINKAG